MGSIRLIQKPVNGQIIFNVPEDMQDETIVIEFHTVREEQRSLVMQTRKGRLKNRTYPTDKYDVYNQ
ncbi:MAG: hypothetical protein EOO39_24600 [Cytophagaceae bacterium]|nr:MAG: hypothetical protein EOO39_24600 [Cytophagaceae bacterium]